MTEILCDGMAAVINGRTGEEYSCTKGSDCPADSYCHLQFGHCCQEGRLFLFSKVLELVVRKLYTFKKYNIRSIDRRHDQCHLM